MSQVSFYQLESTSGNWVDTASTTERTNLLNSNWTEQESPTSDIFQNSADYTGLVVLYRVQKNSNSATFYTTSSAVVSALVGTGLWTSKGTAGYVLPSSATCPAGWGALNEAYNSSTAFYIFTASPTQWSGLGGAWAKSSSIVCYVPSPHS